MNIKKWMIPAIFLGFTFFLAAYVIKPVGVSTQFSVLSGVLHNMISPDVITEDDSRESGYQSTNEYYDRNDGKLAKSIKQPWNYDFVFVLSIPLGGMIGYFLQKKKTVRANQAIKENATGSCGIKQQSKWKQYLISFLGGFMLLYGARMADGCTSGHMMSGMMQGAVSGYIFAAAVFVVAIPIAVMSGRRMKRKGGF